MLRPSDIRNQHHTIEKTDHFCGFLLQIWSESARKEAFRVDFNTKTPQVVK